MSLKCRPLLPHSLLWFKSEPRSHTDFHSFVFSFPLTQELFFVRFLHMEQVASLKPDFCLVCITGWMPYASRFSLVPQTPSLPQSHSFAAECLSQDLLLSEGVGSENTREFIALFAFPHWNKYPKRMKFWSRYIYFYSFLMAFSLLQGPVVSRHLGLTILQEQTAHSQSGPCNDEEERARSQCLFLGHTPHLKCYTVYY